VKNEAPEPFSLTYAAEESNSSAAFFLKPGAPYEELWGWFFLRGILILFFARASALAPVEAAAFRPLD
jgi:hypothetical protein